MRNFPQLPSMKIGVEKAIEENADFHLWLEDDSIVYDEECHKWSELIKDKDIGVYKDDKILGRPYVNCCYCVTTQNLDKRLLEYMQRDYEWDIRAPFLEDGRITEKDIEGRLEQLAHNGKSLLNVNYAGRYHTAWVERGRMGIVTVMNKICPQEIPELTKRFPFDL